MHRCGFGNLSYRDIREKNMLYRRVRSNFCVYIKRAFPLHTF